MAEQPHPQQPQVYPEPNPIYASAFQLRGTSNDVTLILLRGVGASVGEGNDKKEIGALLATGAVVMSPQTAKDLMLVLKDQIAQYEQEFGEIKTEFTRTLKPKK